MFSVPVHLDQQLFLFLNSANSPFWDKVMYTLSMVVVWVPLYLAILICLALRYKRKFLIIILFIIIAVTLTDQIALLIKNSVDRLRPCHEPSLTGLVHLVKGRCGGLYGFVSSHSANSFNVALLSLMFIRKKWFTISIIIWAVAVGYSRIYLGVHYPGDVICGAILGAFIGWNMYRLYDLTDRYFLQHRRYFSDLPSANISQSPQPPEPPRRDYPPHPKGGLTPNLPGTATPQPPKGGLTPLILKNSTFNFMLYINLESTDPFFNLAVDEYLLKNRTEDFLILGINDRSVIIGKHQVVHREVDTRVVTEHNIPVIRRISGGGTVFHDNGNLNFSFIMKSEPGKQVDFRKYTASCH